MAQPVLTISRLAKRFGPVQALGEVDFTLEQGEIHALLGVNGAGKSTFIKILSGVYTKDEGTIEIDGRSVEFRSPRDAIAHGVAAVQQHPELVGDLTGYENIFLGMEGGRRGFWSRIDRASMRRRADALLARFPVEIDLSRRVSSLSVVEREIVAILQALSRENIRVLILDEPTSTLTEVEKGVLFRLMAHLRASGISIIYITHRLEEVMEIVDRLTVFRGGRRITTMSVKAARAEGVTLAELMLGETLDHVYPPRREDAGAGEVVFSVEGLRLPGVLDNIRFDVRRGEIVGVFGLVGSGLDELSKVLFGAMGPAEGKMRLAGREIAPRTPREALANGIFLVPGDRRTEGLTLSQASVFNMTLANLGKASGLAGLLRRGRNRRASAALAEKVTLHPPLLDRAVSDFSGGNQQKIVVAKGLFAGADLYIFVEPTVGVDIGARSRLYGLMRDLAESAAVIVMSSDCDEVHGLSDRTFALYKGRQIGQPSGDITRGRLLAAGIMGSLH
ncbi:sugar ABC transporter ATP-binding protein [Ancylobacter moscoviensis]